MTLNLYSCPPFALKSPNDKVHAVAYELTATTPIFCVVNLVRNDVGDEVSCWLG